jgi:hypothetical protein
VKSMRLPNAQSPCRSLLFGVVAACASEPKRPTGGDSGASLLEVGNDLIGVWRSKAPPDGGNWTDEGCRLTEWIECDLIELSILGWREDVLGLYASGPVPDGEQLFVGSWVRVRCSTEWAAGDAAELDYGGPHGAGAEVRIRTVDDVEAPVLLVWDYFPSNYTGGSPQDIVCERSSPDQLDCGWAIYSYEDLGSTAAPTDRLVLERIDSAGEAILCDELFERYLLSPRSIPRWHDR